MRKRNFLRIYFVVLGIICSQSCYSQITIETVTFADNYTCGGSRFLPFNQSTGKVFTRRAMEQRGTFDYDIPDGMPDSLKMAVDIAIDIWKDYLPGVYCKLRLDYSSAYTNDITTEVCFINDSTNNDVFYPQSLYRKIYGASSLMNTYDATIKIKSTTEWCVGISETVIGKKNLSYAVMRAIALSLGFGASIKKAGNNLCFAQSRGHSVTDFLIFDDNNNYLSDIENKYLRTYDLKPYIEDTTRNIYIVSRDAEHIMYAPYPYDINKTLKYLDNPCSVMHYDDSQTLPLQLDDVTTGILKEIGWNNISQAIRIVGENIDSTGIAAANEAHRFYIEANGASITNHYWELQLPIISGSYQTISSAATSDFNIAALQTPNLYYRTPDGIVYGKILFRGMRNGTEVSAEYTVGLRLAPKIKHAEVVDIIPNAVNSETFDVILAVQYEGCYSVTIYVEEDGTYNQFVYSSNIPYYTNVSLSQLYLWDDTYIDVAAQNSYGSDHFYLMVPAYVYTNRMPSVKNNENNSPLAAPKLVDYSFTYNGVDWIYDHYILNSSTTMRFYCPNADKLACFRYEGDDPNPWGPIISTEKKEGDIFEIHDKDWIWNLTFYKAISILNNGHYSEESEPVIVKDLVTITEPDILEALGLTAIHHATAETSLGIAIKNGKIFTSIPSEEMVSITLSSLNGQILCNSTNSNHMDVSGIPTGMYIIKAKDKSNHLITKKIIL